jgi:single-stranded-DNA-specific exonuclease
MLQFSPRWKVADPISPEAAQALPGFSDVLRNILYQRDIRNLEQAEEYIKALPPKHSDPGDMMGVATAVDRIHQAVERAEPIAVYGDYDADGVTATALLVEAIKELGGNVLGHIPNRFDEGYGLNNKDLEKLSQAGVKLVITVDCGVRSLAEAEYANKLGLDLIITDHHLPGDELPIAISIINPKQPGDTYPDKNLAGVGLAYKLAAGLFGLDQSRADSYLDLVAMGTVADLASLTGENRSLVRRGLGYLRRPTRQGILSLIGAAGLTPANLNTGHIGYALGPRLNAAGRIELAMDALNLLMTRDLREAGMLAQKLDNQNRERQRQTIETMKLAEAIALKENPDALLLFAVSPEFNHGVVGLAASRLSERYYRPAIVAKSEENLTRGSCRSIPEFHITEALDLCKDILVKHGGHAAAAGFTVKNEHLSELIYRLQEIASTQLSNLKLRPTLNADLELPLSDLKPAILEDLKLLEPTGQDNSRAVFVSRNLSTARVKRIGSDGSHLRLEVSDGKIWYPAVAFQKGQLAEQMPARIDIMYHYELNEFNGRQSLQLNLIDLKPSGQSDEGS